MIEKQIQVKKSELPEGWSLDAADFINKLIQNNPLNRLGYYGIYELKKHNWLDQVQWSKIEDRLFPASYVPRTPKIQRYAKLIQADIRNRRLTKENHSLLHSQEFQNLFADFHYKWDHDNDLDFNQKQS